MLRREAKGGGPRHEALGDTVHQALEPLVGDRLLFVATPPQHHALRGVAGREVTTLEGLGTPGKPHPIQRAFMEEQAAQCGFCLNGVILTAKALLDQSPRASDEQIRAALDGVLCRCFAHVRILRAIQRYARGMGK